MSKSTLRERLAESEQVRQAHCARVVELERVLRDLYDLVDWNDRGMLDVPAVVNARTAIAESAPDWSFVTLAGMGEPGPKIDPESIVVISRKVRS